jgi:perosamine synthetase
MKQIHFGRPLIGDEEKEAVMSVLNNPILVHGKNTTTFEENFATFCKAPHAVSVSSCTAGLHLAYFQAKIGAGDEVIVPAQTHTATVHAVEFVGAKPIFIDAEMKTGNIDIDAIEAKITDKTKAITLVHYLGMPVDMKAITEIAKKHNLLVVEDCALSIGATYDGIHTGLLGDLGAFSFYPVKHMTTAEGGMVITTREDIAQKLTKQRAFGVDKHVGERTVPGMYDVTQLGFNYRMNEIEAAIGVAQVKKLPMILKKRKENFEALYAQLEGIEHTSLLQSSHGVFQSSYYCMTLLLDDALSSKRLELINGLRANGIGTSIYYPNPVPLTTYYSEKYNSDKNAFPNASRLSYQSIALPVGPHLEVEDMKIISDNVQKVIKEIL